MLLSLPLTRRTRKWKEDSPQALGLQFENIQFSSPEGIPLRGWWIPAAGSSSTIILLHGYQGSMDPDLQYAPWLHEAGYNILMFDFRAHGRSGGKICTIGALELRDALAAINVAREKGSWRIGLMGFRWAEGWQCLQELNPTISMPSFVTAVRRASAQQLHSILPGAVCRLLFHTPG